MRDKIEALILKGYNLSQIAKLTKVSREVLTRELGDFLRQVGQKYNINYNHAKGLKLEELASIKIKYWEQYEIFVKDNDLVSAKKLLESLVRLIVEEAKIFGLYSETAQSKESENEFDPEFVMSFFAWKEAERQKKKD
jgi:hypothetical protein